MKKKMLFLITFCICLVLLCACQGKNEHVSSNTTTAGGNKPTTGALTMPDYTMKVDGRFARFDNGVEMIIGPGGSAVILLGDMDLSILNSGDSISIYCNGVSESYPEQATVLECELHERGSLSDLPIDTMEAIKEFGYEIKKFEETNMNSYTSIQMSDFYSDIFGTEGDFVVLDVRRADEYAEGHIPGAINVANEDIIDTPPAILPNKSQIIYVYCRSGRRSKEASEKLVKMGYTNIIEFGGILDWPGEIEK